MGKRILSVCIENAGRTQMVEAFVKKYRKNQSIISSARNQPVDKFNQMVVQVMQERVFDISENKPKLITFQMGQKSDLIVTMGCNDQGICPEPFFKPTIDWKVENPEAKAIEKAIETRDENEHKVQRLIEKNE
jgi:protein-tyrosine-phosphatase